ncbi:Late competence protein ComEC, DNA transport [Streptococcus sp. DD11]|nr:Late competence protein ComEC, DNA transport [Streptococcus sp. DD11]
MSQWIEKLPLPPLYLVLILVWVYFAVYTGGLLAYLGLGLLVVRLFAAYPLKKALLALVLLGLFAGLFLFRREMAEQAFRQEPKPVSWVQPIPDTIQVNGDSLSFRGRGNGQTYQVFYKLKSEKEKEAFQKLSDQVRLEIAGEFSLAQQQRNFAGFDYRAYLKTEGIYRTLTISAIKSVQPVSDFQPWDWPSLWRRKALVYIQTHFPKPMSHYMGGLLFGQLDTGFAEMNELYSSLGIIHLFALSGMQVAYFADGFRRILLRLGLKMETVHLLQLPFFLIYAGLTGFSVSVVRSLLQKLLAQLGLKGPDNVAVTLLILFILMPNVLLTAGGVLSCSYAFLLAMLNFDHLPPMRKVLAESLTLSLGILPVLLYYFAEFQPWSLLLTFLFSVLFDRILLPGLTAVFLLSPLIKLTQVNFFLTGWKR